MKNITVLQAELEREARQVKKAAKVLKINSGVSILTFNSITNNNSASKGTIYSRSADEDILLSGDEAGNDFELINMFGDD